MKENLLKALEKAKDDAQYWIYKFSPEGTYKMEKKIRGEIIDLISKAELIFFHEDMKDVIMLGEIGLSAASVEENIYYETINTEGYVEHVSKYNPYHKVYIKLDKDNKTIEFKLGDRHKKLELIESGEYVSKPHYSKWLKVVSADDLEKHIGDEFWNPRMVHIGRTVLKMKGLKLA
ncbi:hypothetical protein [Cytobacillus oceanisediminis]|uniref:hypothetical protein n=1 Tax=Cytobacillus oceanisediminis TaxID=665099 RepID=UPI001FB49DB7|nr:hypothetical protein [Cytobacillus oceanisediminis]UOE58165.1 hypothetical protein IRB79_27040 [Cytobacillus oceanisediminis]